MENYKIKFEQYLAEFVYGGIDGSITTFAVVAGAYGAHFDSAVIIILGLANLIADGFSMSVGSFLSAKSEKQQYNKLVAKEYWEIENKRESEIEEVRAIFLAKGFEGKLLEEVVAKITENKTHWVDIMMKHELEIVPENKTPFMKGMATFISFIIIGFIPLFIYVFDFFFPVAVNLFYVATLLTSFAFVGIGWLKSYVTQTSFLRGILETLFLGIIAALLAYGAGSFLENLILSN